MDRCLVCEYALPLDRESLGARCPRCRHPLFEPLGRVARPVREGEAACAAHPAMESVGPCARCAAAMCETCRTAWRGELCCAACVDRALGSGEAEPEQQRAHGRQAQAALLFGGGAWVLAGLALAAGGPLAARGGPVLAAGVLVAVLVGVVLGAVGAGQGVAALRGRGGRGPVAVAGLVFGGVYAGVVIGLGLFYLWQS